MSFREKLIEKLGASAEFINNLKYIMVIKQAFVLLMPVIITGAFAILINNVVLSADIGLAKYGPFAFLAELSPIMSSISYATLNFLTIGAVFFIGLELGKLNGQKSIFSGLLALMSYIAIIPTQIMMELDGGQHLVTNIIDRQFTDTRSLFLGMIIAIISVELYSKLLTIDKLKIKMPDTVPSNVAASFSALIPTIFTVFIIATFGFTFHAISGLYLHEAIYTVVQQPLEKIMQGLPGVLFLYFVAQVFWVIGIHGNQMIKPIREPLLLGAITVNMTAFEEGKEIPNIITMPFWDTYMNVGGSGLTIGLIIAIFIASKRDDWKSVAKISAVPSIFNINETMIFGLPIMLNPIMAIPFIITPLITGTIGYIATAIGFAGKAVVMVPWTTPPILSAWLSTAGSMGAVITQIGCIAVAILIYLPFVFIANKQVNQTTDTKSDITTTEVTA